MNSQSDRDFSLVLGGPLYQLFLKTRLARPPLELLARRVVVISSLAWFPPCLLSILAGTAVGGVSVPYFNDLATHVRFLVALPLLIVAEGIVHERMQPMIEQFIARGIIPEASIAQFKAAQMSVRRWRNSIGAELFLLAITFTLGHFFWVRQGALKTDAWYADSGSAGNLTPAGLWYVWISLPIFQFILLRWLYRWILWVGFLWKVARLPLHLIPTHPDRAGGLSFLTYSSGAFSPIVSAMSAALAGTVAGKIFFEGATLLMFRAEILSILLVLLLLVLGPLCLFTPHLLQAKRRGRWTYGSLASTYVEAFDSKWAGEKAKKNEDLLGSADIQSLADMGNSYAVLDAMRPVPFNRESIVGVAIAALLPVFPLVLTIIPLDQLMRKLLTAIF